MIAFLRKKISSNIREKIRYIQPSFFYKKSSYSQSGEDLIISALLERIYGDRPKKYLDIGAHHPFLFSNTALLYLEGGQGILVEPDPSLSKTLKIKRPRDKTLQCGIHISDEDQADFFIMSPPTLNTFSELEMQHYVDMGHKLIRKITVKLRSINSLLEEFGHIDFMNIDIEGLDEVVLKMINWEKYRPSCICVETINYAKKEDQEKSISIINFMKSQGYLHYADTFINSIFVDKKIWPNKKTSEVL